MSESGGVPPIRESGFAAEVSLVGPVALTLRGNADSSTTTSLVTLIERLHQVVVDQGVRSVLVDLAQLEFMNASSINVFVNWLALVQDLPDEQRYVLRFRANPKLPWQERTLHTLACFASDLVEIGA